MGNMIIRPVRYIQRMLRGSSRPQLILMSDGFKYAVKFKNNSIQGTRSLVNEYVAGRLARMLHLPVPQFQIVYIPQTFIRANLSPYKFAPGHQFASRFIDNCVREHAKRCLPNRRCIINGRQLAGIIVFDQWVSNIDRKVRNILLKKTSRQGRYQIYMIDHGHSFSRNDVRPNCKWTPHTLSCLPQKLKWNDFYQWCMNELHSPNELLRFVKMIEQLPDQKIYKVILSIPKDWHVSQAEKESLYAYLKRAKRQLRNLIIQYIKNR
ncbi:HipA family kinase [Salinithrix halophila]|uniref:HipA family kinase n=1 Tax=Salinithrix halophila TaxID=1485204 RepID=A0ABV8JBV1_9BACL